METAHKERAHSKFSASGSERWLNCAASVGLEEKSPPSKDNVWSKEGTLAHEVLEATLLRKPVPAKDGVTPLMLAHVDRAANKIRGIQKAFGGTLLVEKRVHASFIHDEMFGTCDAIVAGDNRMLHIIDFKYGAGHVVSPEENTQLIQYALSVAESYGWGAHFDLVKMWILQPRAGGEWAKSWVIGMDELENAWLPLWHKGVARVERGNSKPYAGSWCHWCRATKICPTKVGAHIDRASKVFQESPLTEGITKNGVKEKGKEESSKEKSSFQKSKTKGKEESDFY